jgi:hypothetical protein
MHAMIRTAPPQAAQVSISIPKTNFQWQVCVWLQPLIRFR